MALSFYISAAFLPQNLPADVNSYRCVSVSCSSVIKSQLFPTRRHSFSTANRVPHFGGIGRKSINVELVGVPTSVPVRVAHELLLAGHHYLDIRTPDEFNVGHVVHAVNVPFLLRLGPGMTRNPNFLEQVLTIFSKDDEIIVGCQLGKRSFMAASELLSAGFSGITDMAGGYAVWVQNGLPSTE